MQIKLIAVGTKMPSWVVTGFQEYAKRIQGPCTLTLHEIPAQKRDKNTDLARLLQREGDMMLSAIHSNDYVIALDVTGKSYSTEKLSTKLETLMQQGQHISLLIGGPEGLAEQCLARSDERWSLSALTFPHPLVRIIIAEQLYRALSIIKQHPYHK
ncbi:MAG: 23S rRNA (pseudouridine(1915)-N(3))-methyltransferase RlmH [Legionellaceae bacterium]|nr:23S rRNA (pseudouridine(1915)-N(3))-methyltransferase RlmH [Legionellaceae bacterium]